MKQFVWIAGQFEREFVLNLRSNISSTWVERFNVHARPGATAVIKEINPLLLKTYAVDTTS
jgi:hypothetical protein